MLRVTRLPFYPTRYFPRKGTLRNALCNDNSKRLGGTRSINIFECVNEGKLADIELDCIRNFSVIAHVDHGKSTLSDCILQLAGNISEKDRKRGQVLDTLKVERDRGITVKAQTATMIFEDSRNNNKRYLINIIDTPGHIDFSYEVSRSLASCQGALLLVDSSQSIQAQTLANHAKAKALGLNIIPIVTKIDLPNAQPIETALMMGTTFGVDPDKVIMTSAKKNIGIKEVLEAVIDELPSPKAAFGGNASGNFHGKIVDSWFDEHRGVVCLIQAVAGSLQEGDRVATFASMKEAADLDTRSDFSVQEIGILTPTPLRTSSLTTGQVGYVICGMRTTRQARIGDTMYIPGQWNKGEEIVPLEGYEAAKPMLYASVFPVDSAKIDDLFASVDRLCLNDSSVSVAREQSSSLGSGLRCGFLGFLHMEVFIQRLSDEFDMQIVMTTPSVPYIIERNDGTRTSISSVTNWPEPERNFYFRVLEPMVKIVLVTPKEYYGAMVDVIKERRGSNVEVQYLDDGVQVLITSIMPWQEVVCDMNDQVKHNSSGYASFNYEDAGYSEADLVKVEIAVNGEACDALSFISHSSKATSAGRKLASKLKDVLARQQFEIIIQARVGAKVLARERIAPYRKDVLVRSGKLVGGGDITRKKKLLEKQKEGKKRAKMVGKVEISQEAFFSVLQR